MLRWNEQWTLEQQKTIIIILVKFYLVCCRYTLPLLEKLNLCVCVCVCEMFVFSFRRHSIKWNLWAQRQNGIIIVVVVFLLLLNFAACVCLCVSENVFDRVDFWIVSMLLLLFSGLSNFDQFSFQSIPFRGSVICKKSLLRNRTLSVHSLTHK